MRKNALKFTSNDEEISQLYKAHQQVINEANLDKMAKETNFLTRKRKISPLAFLKALVFNEQNHEQLTLLGLKCELADQNIPKISQQAVHKRFTGSAVSFLQNVFSALLFNYFSFQNELDEDGGSPFTSINIKDSTKFRLPACYADIYPSFGRNAHDKAMMNIQYEYDLLNGQWKSMDFTKANRNDQADSKQAADQIQPASLNIRDLGYVTTTYLKAVDKNGAYYLNRLPGMGAYLFQDGKYVPVDWKQIDRQMREQGLESMEMEVFINKKEKLKTRLILQPVPKKIKDERIRKAKKAGKRTKGYNISKEYSIKAGYNIYITNTVKKDLPTEKVHQTYRLRWQIELIFKTWKSNLEINKVKAVKKERMECQLIAKFIWIMLNSKLFQISNNIIREASAKMGCSHFKFFKRMKKLSHTLITAIESQDALIEWFKHNIIAVIDEFIIDKKKGKSTYPEILNELIDP